MALSPICLNQFKLGEYFYLILFDVVYSYIDIRSRLNNSVPILLPNTALITTTEPTINDISVEQHRKAYEIGMQIGETSDAINNLLFLISRMIECGKYGYYVLMNMNLCGASLTTTSGLSSKVQTSMLSRKR